MQLPGDIVHDYFAENRSAVLTIKREVGNRYMLRTAEGNHSVFESTSNADSVKLPGGYRGKLYSNGSFGYGNDDSFQFTDEAFATLKAFHLARVVRGDLTKLTPAIVQLIKHRKSMNAKVQTGSESFVSPVDIQLTIYRLVNADFDQPFKGSVLISIRKDGGRCENGDVLKGYTYVKEKETILYESVQAWRYEQVDQAWLVTNGFDFSGLVD